ncbi:very short patch repair endonuclease [Vibrio mediterranei]|uniref:very short patch repair endonuclease n=1 Tax=Vibrio mediterranei TaxID=689 RepID=UPI001EFD0BB9|nr:DNA mismatch endonuclease Vsr [Vibrio mediterranei]
MNLDVHDKETRSKNMRAIKSRDTKPELMIRRLLHRNGYRFRVSSSRLPGKPDIWMAKWNTAIFVNGCFWHKHDCEMFKLPGTRTDFWLKKLEGNSKRDREKIQELTSSGIRVLVIWECSLRGKAKLTPEMLLSLVKTFLLTDNQTAEISSEGLIFTS